MQKVGIIGLGSFGILLTELLTPHVSVTAYSRRGQIDGLAPSVKLSTLEQVCQSDIVIIASEFAGLANICQQIKPFVTSQTLVMDVCSVKIKPVEVMQSILGDSCKLVATHPLFGPHSVARQGIKGQKMVICEISAAASEQVNSLFQNSLGLEIIHMSPDEHDREMAWVHSLTFFVGRGLLELQPPNSNLATGYYRQLLELVAIERSQSWELFKTVELGNPYSASMRQQLMASLQKLNDDLGTESDV